MDEMIQVVRGTHITKLDKRDVPEQLARPESGRMVRLYSTQYQSRWALQIRGPLGIGRNGAKDGQDFIVANAPLDREEMKALRDSINYHLLPDGTEKAGDDQIAGRINSCLDYMVSAAGKGDMRNVSAWATEIRGLVEHLAPSGV